MKPRTLFLIGLLALASLIAFLDIAAMAHYLFWKFWWYDIMMHALGGLLFGGVFIWVVHYELSEAHRARLMRPLYAILFVFTIGVVWEVFEFFAGSNLGYSNLYYAFDTIKDLCMDCIGGASAYFLYSQKRA